MKMHIGTDTQGRVHRVVVTDAATHDSTMMDDFLHGEETTIYGDKAYASQEKKEKAESSGVTWRVSRKAKRIRAKVEHVFGVVKNLWGVS